MAQIRVLWAQTVVQWVQEHPDPYHGGVPCNAPRPRTHYPGTTTTCTAAAHDRLSRHCTCSEGPTGFTTLLCSIVNTLLTGHADIGHPPGLVNNSGLLIKKCWDPPCCTAGFSTLLIKPRKSSKLALFTETRKQSLIYYFFSFSHRLSVSTSGNSGIYQ